MYKEKKLKRKESETDSLELRIAGSMKKIFNIYNLNKQVYFLQLHNWGLLSATLPSLPG